MKYEIYRKNMKLIKSLNSCLYNEIKSIEISTVKKVKTKNNEDNIVKKVNGNDYMIHSQYDPKYQAKYIAQSVFKDNYDIIFLFGLGLGYELKEMIRLNNNIRYFVVEPDEEIFKMLVENCDIKFLFGKVNVHFILGKNPEDIGRFYNDVIGVERSLKIKFLVLPSYQNIYEDLIYSTFLNIKEKINIFRVNIHTGITSHRQWVQNYIGNLKYLDSVCPVTKLKEKFSGEPAILVSAGPSLDYNIEVLRRIQGKVLIATAGSGINILENKKIKADIICMIDGWQNESDLIENAEINKNSSLFYSNMLYYTIVDKLGGPKFLLNMTNMDTKVYDIMGQKPFETFSGPSVANSLAYNLSQLGCNPIIFLGQDLCYSSGKNYAEGAIYEKDMSMEFKNKGYIKLKNKNNEDVYTTPVFLAMKSSMEYCIKLYPHIKYLNGTSDGLKIYGAEDIDFNKYAEEYFMNGYHSRVDLKDIYGNFINKHLNFKKIEYMKESLENENNRLIKILKDSLIFLESELDKSKITKYIEKVYKRINNMELYRDIINPDLCNLEYIHKNRNYIEKNKQKLAYILDKCLIIQNAFTYIVKGGNKIEM